MTALLHSFLLDGRHDWAQSHISRQGAEPYRASRGLMGQYFVVPSYHALAHQVLLLCAAGCHITLYYYAGFSYLMMRRWLDAARAFNIVLSYIAR